MGRAIHAQSQAFRVRFEETFALSSKLVPNNASNVGGREFSDRDVEAGMAAMSSLLGGIGYFHGVPRLGDAVDVRTGDHADPMGVHSHIGADGVSTEPVSLMSATPSRTAFPRGFLWDEGFHQLLAAQWDVKITVQVLSHWLGAMYSHNGLGWIPREMILGHDGSKRVRTISILCNFNTSCVYASLS